MTDEDPAAAVESTREEMHDCDGTECGCVLSEGGAWKVVAKKGRKSRICVPEQARKSPEHHVPDVPKLLASHIRLGESRTEPRTSGTTVARARTGLAVSVLRRVRPSSVQVLQR